MRLFPILAAILVAAMIYVFVFERDRLLAALPSGSPANEEASVPLPTQPDSTKPDADAIVRVVAVKSHAREIDSAVMMRGQTDAYRDVDLRAETAGQVISEPLRKGAYVEAGDLLCELDPGTRRSALAEAEARLAEARSRVPEAEARAPAAEATLAEARARVEEAKARLDEANINANAASRLSEGGFASETRVASTLAAVRGAEAAVVSAEAGMKSATANLETAASGIEAAKAGVESARAAVAAAKREIDWLSIRAPFAGLLETDTAELGSLLQRGDLCATVIQLDPILLVGFVPETQVSRVTTGAPATARLSSGVQVKGEVTFLSRTSDPSTRTFRVEVQADNGDLALSGGLTAEIAISAEGADAHLLPQSALTLNGEGDLGVRIVDTGNTVAFRPVALLRDAPNGVWVGGLPEVVDVIVIGQEFVTDGVRVAVTYQEAIQ